jgi:hypothetical protein
VVVTSFSYLTGRKAKIGPAKIMANFSAPITKNASLDAPIIIWPWPTVKLSEKHSCLTLIQFFDAKPQFSGRIDGTIQFALLFYLRWNQIHLFNMEQNIKPSSCNETEGIR